jgi:hypothetical protein
LVSIPFQRAERSAFLVLALAPDELVEALARLLELRLSALDHAEAPLEAEREAGVEELEQIDVGARLLAHLVQEQEELLAAAGLAVEGDEQALLHPLRASAPGRGRHRLVEERAQRVARHQHRLGLDAALLRGLLEGAELLEQRLAEARRVRVRHGGADLRHQREQRVRQRHQRIQPESAPRSALSAASARFGASPAAGAGPGAAAARRRPGVGTMMVASGSTGCGGTLDMAFS